MRTGMSRMTVVGTIGIALLVLGAGCGDDAGTGGTDDANNGTNNGPANNGGNNGGLINNGGPANNGANNGPANNGPANNGPANNGPANNGPANNGPANNGANNGPANNGAGSCDFNGQAAVKIDVDVAWDSGLAIEAGSGTLEIWFSATLDHNGNVIAVTGNPCEVVIPDFETNVLAGGEKVGTAWPQGIWAGAGIPKIDLTVNLAASEPGSQITIPPGPLVLGATFNDDLNDPWPGSWTGLNATDHDGDGKPGVTTLAKTGNGYGMPRLDIFNDQVRADQIYLAFRTILSLDGVIDSCEGASGAATFTMEQHAVGCHVAGGGECNNDQVNLLDNNLPQFRVTGANFELRKVAQGASCNDIIAALP